MRHPAVVRKPEERFVARNMSAFGTRSFARECAAKIPHEEISLDSLCFTATLTGSQTALASG
jgi:hypothetical protein